MRVLEIDREMKISQNGRNFHPTNDLSTNGMKPEKKKWEKYFSSAQEPIL